MTAPTQPLESRGTGPMQAPPSSTDRWPVAARASLVMSLCGLFWGVLGAVVLSAVSR